MKSQDVFKSKVNPARTDWNPCPTAFRRGLGTGGCQLSKVYVGLSGGVDSSVSAALLKKQGFDVTGVFIKVWQPDFIECTWKEDRLDAMRVCAKLDIPFIELNLEKEYKKEVADYMIAEYKAGKTPNPDVMCNKQIKFGAFYNFARNQGADYIATGHYARIVKRKTYNAKRKNEKIKSSSHPLHATCYTLHVASDANKDQSYFLWNIKQEQLPHILFPVGGMLKPEVRRLAKRFGLITADKKDSQGLCFLGKIDMKEFLKNYIKLKPGNVLLAPSGVEGNEK
ncbi:MAG: tRNA 2-thiouridine(34) synthase MnmA, partial [bacterium]|nr:tRNA 2-thiouridine(34) synthase MnmA [bacterium]